MGGYHRNILQREVIMEICYEGRLSWYYSAGGHHGIILQRDVTRKIFCKEKILWKYSAEGDIVKTQLREIIREIFCKGVISWIFGKGRLSNILLWKDIMDNLGKGRYRNSLQKRLLGKYSTAYYKGRLS